MAKNNKRHNDKPEKKKLSDKAISWIAIAIVFGTILVVVLGIVGYNYLKIALDRAAPADRGDSPAIDGDYEALDGAVSFDEDIYTITTSDNAVDKAGLMTELKNRDEQARSYQFLIQDKDTGDTFEMNYWVDSASGVGVYEYIFKGYDVGVDLEGIYYRSIIDGKPTIIDYQTKEYHIDDEFFLKHMPKLSQLTHDLLLEKIYKDGASFEIGTNAKTGATVMLRNGLAISAKHTSLKDVRILDTRIGGKTIGYSILYGKAYSWPAGI